MKNNKVLTAGIIGAVLLVGVAATYLIVQASRSQEQQVKGSSFKEQWGKTQIIVGLDQEYPPMTFRDEKGELVGFDVDLAKEAFRRIGLEPVFKPMDWSTIVLSLTNKDIDVIWSGMTITSERQEKIDFSKAYFKGSYVYILKSGSSVSAKSDLAGKVVGVQAGSSNEEDLKADPLAKQIKEIKSYSSFQESLLDLDNGRLDAVFGDGVFAYYYINSKGMNYKVIEEAGTDQGAGIGIRKTDQALLAEINRVMDEMKKDGAGERISKQWFGKDMLVK